MTRPVALRPALLLLFAVGACGGSPDDVVDVEPPKVCPLVDCGGPPRFPVEPAGHGLDHPPPVVLELDGGP